jgi:nonsense-mediated mRNA decay protein 3
MTSLNVNNDLADILSTATNIPDIILVKKKHIKKGPRIWKLQHMEIEKEEAVSKKDLKNQLAVEEQYEEFKREIEEDKELRKKIPLYRDEVAIKELEGQMCKMNIEEDNDDVKIDELLDELTLHDNTEKDPEPLPKEEEVDTYRILGKKAERDGTPKDEDD